MPTLTQQHVRRFAAASGDRNPLHLDEAVARRTPYGRCIAHGALAGLLALAGLDPRTLSRARRLEARFPRPVMPGDALQAERTGLLRGADTAVLRTRGQDVARVSVTVGEDSLPALEPRPSAARAEPRSTASGTNDPLTATCETWSPDLAGLRALAAELGAAHVPDVLLVWLAAASYTVGMLSPGADALFASARIEWAPPVSPAQIAVGPVASRSATGLLTVRADLHQGPASATLMLRAFARTAVERVTRRSMEAVLIPSRRLAGSNVLVVGASRGLGAGISVGLALQGATVWAVHARGADDVQRLAREVGGERIRSVRCDVTDELATRAAVARVIGAAGELSGVVLNAAPPPRDAPLVPEATAFVLAYVQRSLAMVLNPLVNATPHLATGGWLAFVSSSWVEDPPRDWAHYVAAKGAIERLAEYVGRHGDRRVAILRPPRLRTDMTNGPLGVAAATAVEPIAAQLVDWVIAGGPSGGVEILALRGSRADRPPSGRGLGAV
jgi:NAD(P)-dependent dehydrogenase (short-subunit alcohol dehydrogenase family)/acyl dehydratase